MWFGPPECNTVHPREKRVVVLLKPGLASVCLSLSSSIICHNLLKIKPVAGTLCCRIRQVALGGFDPYYIGSCHLRKGNDVFNGMEVIASYRPSTLFACKRDVGLSGHSVL
jgi:hypothetical protein